jgi:hypothetical protein
MNIFICCSKNFYHHIPQIKQTLEQAGHTITLPISYENPSKEASFDQSSPEYREWKAATIREHETKIRPQDAILVLNFEKNGQPHYIGGATFLEIFKAFELGKKIFLYNPLPQNIFYDELIGMSPIVINGNLALIQ